MAQHRALIWAAHGQRHAGQLTATVLNLDAQCCFCSTLKKGHINHAYFCTSKAAAPVPYQVAIEMRDSVVCGM